MRIVIAGAGEVGTHLAKMLSREGGEVTVIDDDPARIAKLNLTADVVAVTGEPSSVKVLKEAGAASADLFIAVNPHKPQSVNVLSALLAKQLGTKRVIARVDDAEYLTPENKLMFKDIGLDTLFCPEKTAADEIIDLLRHTASNDSLDFARGRLQLSVFKIDDESPLLDMKVAEFTAAMTEADPMAQFRIIAISRRGETIIPKFDTRFKYMDNLYIIARREGMVALTKYLGKENLEIKSVMILGGSRIGEMVAAQLAKAQMEEVKIIDYDMARCRELSDALPDSVSVAHGDARNSDFLVEENIKV